MNREHIIELMHMAEKVAGEPIVDYLERFAALVAAHEREQCAKVCESSEIGDGRAQARYVTAAKCAAAIRKKGLNQ